MISALPNPMVAPSPATGSPPIRLLALHGSGSNRQVTQLQLNNLGLLRPQYHILYLHGPRPLDQPGLGVGAGIPGPWYGWLPRTLEQITLEELLDTLHYLLRVLEQDGPFDYLFGFSEGGWLASLLCGLSRDEWLLRALCQRHPGAMATALQPDRVGRGAIIACAALAFPLWQLRSTLGWDGEPAVVPEIPSLHLIGRQDPHRPWSEALALAMNSTHTQVYYLNGGHGVDQSQANDPTLLTLVDQFMAGSALAPAPALRWRKTSDLSSRGLVDTLQVQTVAIATDQLPTTILAMLAAQPSTAPLLREARQQDSRRFTSYGEVLRFCQPGGGGDLRQLRVQPGQVVAYLAPPGGSATSALAFLSIACQTCAAPLDPRLSEADTWIALEQLRPQHLVLFVGMAGPAAEAAFEGYAQTGKAELHRAVPLVTGSPGLFRYLEPRPTYEQQPSLLNAADAPCLLLRTSGTTGVAKVVPLRQRDLVWNGVILAEGLGLTRQDITYSIMPLYHIGGISASVLASLAVGATITGDGAYTPETMVEALSHSNPPPTWYSAVPTIHNATVRHLYHNPTIQFSQDGAWRGHQLRLIRSGAAALQESDRQLLEKTYGCPVVTTYSMSEQMPICQPPRTAEGWQQTPASVGVPVATSLAIVNPLTLNPLPLGVEGEVAIAGATLFSGYLDNPLANQQAWFLLRSPADGRLHSWFLTGDLGQTDTEGVLTLGGRVKEMIKKGGEQIAPLEVEALLTQHPWIDQAVCFPVPSEIYGEEVGCALVVDPAIADRVTLPTLLGEIRPWLRTMGLATYKYPSVWKLVRGEELPRTASHKYVRQGLFEVLGIAPRRSELPSPPPGNPAEKPKLDWSVVTGFQFVLVCYVMLMHFGSEASLGPVANLRQFPWHIHSFFTLAGFSLAISMPSPITKPLAFIKTRIAQLYPLYLVAVGLGLVHLLISCRPTTFSPDFHWIAQAGDLGRVFCEGTPWLPSAWGANLALTLGIYLTGLQATPLWKAAWFLGFYLWYISVYVQCLVIFPFAYNALYQKRGQTPFFLALIGAILGTNLLVMLGFWFGYAAQATGTPAENAAILDFYLCSPLWMVYFLVGMAGAFLYDRIRPLENWRGQRWGYLADAITLVVVGLSLAHIAQGNFADGHQFWMRPEAANSIADVAVVNRLWDDLYARLFAPLTLVWILTLSTGQGLTAKGLRLPWVARLLAPTVYGCFLFHQMVGQWYYALTRGQWWNWWSYRKAFYWFSPQPSPVKGYEFFLLVILVVLFARLVRPVDRVLRQGWARSGLNHSKTSPPPAGDALAEIIQIVEQITGMEAKAEWTLEECGLASLDIAQFTNILNTQFSSRRQQKVNIPMSEVISAANLGDLAAIINQHCPSSVELNGGSERSL